MPSKSQRAASRQAQLRRRKRRGKGRTREFAAGPVSMSTWTSTYTERGVCGDATLATKEKGQLLFEEAITRLIEWADEFHNRQFNDRADHHLRPPTTPVRAPYRSLFRLTVEFSEVWPTTEAASASCCPRSRQPPSRATVASYRLHQRRRSEYHGRPHR